MSRAAPVYQRSEQGAIIRTGPCLPSGLDLAPRFGQELSSLEDCELRLVAMSYGRAPGRHDDILTAAALALRHCESRYGSHATSMDFPCWIRPS